MNVKKEIELAIKRENPDWDGKSFDYGINIYKSVQKCWEAIEPILYNDKHSVFSYSIFCDIFKRVLDGKVLTPIVEEDFLDGYSMTSEVFKGRGVVEAIQCPRYFSLFKHRMEDGTIEYKDVDRIVVIDQYITHTSSWEADRFCKEYIPKIKLPYMPAKNPIKIYTWSFNYDKKKKLFSKVNEEGNNALYIRRIVLQDGEIIDVNKCYVDANHNDNYEELKLTPKMFKQLSEVVK